MEKEIKISTTFLPTEEKIEVLLWVVETTFCTPTLKPLFLNDDNARGPIPRVWSNGAQNPKDFQK